MIVTMLYCFANFEEANQVTSDKQTIAVKDYTFVPQAIPVVQMNKKPMAGLYCLFYREFDETRKGKLKLISSAGCVREYVTLGK